MKTKPTTKWARFRARFIRRAERGGSAYRNDSPGFKILLAPALLLAPLFWAWGAAHPEDYEL